MKLLSPFSHITLIDDNKTEVQHILDIFQDQNVPYTYYEYNGTPGSLPRNKSSNIRLIFMDLYLLEDGTELQPENVSGRFLSVLDSVVEKNTPYILVIWSKHIKNQDDGEAPDPSYLSVVSRLDTDPELSPLAIIPLDKKDIFLNTETGLLDFNNAQQDLETAIINALGTNNVAKPLLHWNSLVGFSAETTLMNIRELLVSKKFSQDYFERLMFEFARAYLGKHTSGKKEKYKTALNFITDIFKDNLEESIENIPDSETIDFTKNKTSPPNQEDFALINFKTLLSENPVSEPIPPGSVFAKKKKDFDYYHDQFDQDLINITDLIRFFRNEQGMDKKPSKDEAKKIIQELINDCIYITVNVTPVCDFAQNKYRYHKYCMGILFPQHELDDKFLRKRSANLYFSPVFKFKERPYRLILDYRLITDDLCDAPKLEDFIFRIREQPLMDIHYKMSNHMGRPGIVFLDKNLL